MQHRQAVLLAITVGLHCVAVILAAALLYLTRGMTAFCIVPAALVACVSAATVSGKPINLYIAFGLFVGFGFWVVVSAVNQRDWLSLLPPVLLVAGGVWLLQAPSWPSLTFSGVAILLCLGLAMLMFSKRPDFADPVPDRARKSALTTFGILLLASSYASVGFAETLVARAGATSRAKRKKKRIEDEDDEE
jgi:hypothetical protein